MRYDYKEFNNVKKYQLNDRIIAWQENDVLFINHEPFKPVKNFILNGSNIIYSTMEGDVENVYQLNLFNNNSELILGNVSLGDRVFANNLISLTLRSLNKKAIFDVDKKKIVFQSVTPINSVFDKNVFVRKGSIFSSLSLLTGELEWESILNSFGEIRKILGVIDDKIWVVMYRGGDNQDKNRLIALNIHTGKTEIELPDSLPISEVHLELIQETKTILSIWGKISTYHEADSPLVEINAINGEIIRNHRIESLYDANLKMGKWIYKDNKIFFHAAMDFINSTHIGVLDYQTLELLWFTEVKERKAGLRDLQVSDDKIYVLDHGHQLHIYERVHGI